VKRNPPLWWILDTRWQLIQRSRKIKLQFQELITIRWQAWNLPNLLSNIRSNRVLCSMIPKKLKAGHQEPSNKMCHITWLSKLKLISNLDRPSAAWDPYKSLERGKNSNTIWNGLKVITGWVSAPWLQTRSFSNINMQF